MTYAIPSALRSVTVAVGAVCAMLAGEASAISLRQAYEAALQNDPAYRMNYYENESAKENRILGRAALLPNISASYSASRNRADIEALDAIGRTSLTHPNYISRSAIVQLRQPIVNLEAIARYRQGKAQTKLGAEVFEANTAEVALRVVGAYSDALFADDQLALSQVQRDMYAEQQKVNQRLFEKGEGTRTDMLETQARLDLSEAQLLEARDNLKAQRTTLESVIGMDPGALDKLGTEFRFEQLTPSTFEEWKAIALTNNHDLAAARLQVEVARLEIGRQRAGHAPRLDLIATYSKGDSETLNTYTQNTVNRSIGIQLNVPIYAGGAVNATTRQAAAGYERAKADLDLKTNKVLLELRKAHDLTLSSVARVAALVKSTESGKELMKATEQSIKGGVRINLDLLNAQQQLFTSQRDLAAARYSYLLGLLRLRSAAGTLEADNIRQIAAYFR
ncbi:TolC family outer membrane protein [Massilia sp. TWR1-2-2]|uniref:TolC family outer membrane protein n=1 Tax=Massilia sp. TWR1-2-2 TaxID=2804584 RepID=UPI003CEC9681